MKNPIKEKPTRYVWVCEIHGAGKPKKIVYDAIDLATRGERIKEESQDEKSDAENAP